MIESKIIWHKDKPRKNGTYFVITKSRFGTYYDILNFAKNLYKVDNYDFYNSKRSGWYKYDSEYGHYEVINVVLWAELPDREKILSKVEKENK